MGEAALNESYQYLTFTLDDEVFGVNIATVREVLEYNGVTKVPRVPDFMRGVINLRGSVVPVIDLRVKFGMGAAEQTVNTCVIITEVEVDGEPLVLGALADSVHEVVDLPPDSVEPPPRIGTRIDTRFIQGMGKRGDEFVILLDVDQLFTAAELAEIAAGDEE